MQKQSMRKRHTPKEVEEKLARGAEMASQGKKQIEIARALGITVMTYSRWRKAAKSVQHDAVSGSPSRRAPTVRELEMENARLRDLVVRMLLAQDKAA
jgi:transposase-like protein